MNKNFIPNEFNKRKEKENTNSIKRGVLLLLIGNLIILPINIGSFKKDKETKNKETKKSEEVNELNYKNDVIKWVNIIDEYSRKATVSENKGELLLEDEDKLKDIQKEIKVVKISKNINDYYINAVGE
ncbi:MAG: hypothetical protein ACRCVJ_01415 [Clostridium sp.]|uniref:hypothetical protein n=1 Tax=Clostridium sp. TaxID=1506 RepID=UPI003F30E97D